MIRECEFTGSLAAVLLFASASNVWAATTTRCNGDGPWIAVELRDVEESDEPGFHAAILGHLNAGLGGYGLRACWKSVEPERAPLAEIAVSGESAGSVRVSVEVRDAVTAKRVARDVDIAGYTREGRAFAIAATAEELVRASWAELELQTRRDDTPPPEVAEVVRDSLGTDRAPSERNLLGARMAVEHFAGGQTHFGPDVLFEHWFGRRIGLALAFGPRLASETEHVPEASVASSAMAGELAAMVSLIPGDELEVALALGGRGGIVGFEGRSNADDMGASDATAPFASVRTGPVLSYAPARVFRVSVRAGVGVAVLGAEASANGRAVTAVSGWETHAAVAAGAAF